MFGTLVSDMQENVVVADCAITGTLKYLDEGALVENYGAGYYMAIKVSDIDERATSVKIGMKPSEGTGLVEIIDDPDKNGAFKVTDKDAQDFVMVQRYGDIAKTQGFDLSGLTLAPKNDTEGV